MPFFFGSYSCLKPFRKVLPRAFLPNCFQNQLFLYCCRNALHLIQSLYINTLTANKSSTLSDPFLEMIQYGRSINKNERKKFNYAMNIENFLCFVSLNKHDGHWFRNCDHGSGRKTTMLEHLSIIRCNKIWSRENEFTWTCGSWIRTRVWNLFGNLGIGGENYSVGPVLQIPSYWNDVVVTCFVSPVPSG